jgi:xanthine dehydrogenase accessory factor
MDILNRINKLLDGAEQFCLVTVIASTRDGIVPGHKVLLFPDGRIEYGTQQHDIDELLCTHAQRLLKDYGRELIEIVPGVAVFFDPLSAKAQLIICGAGHIAVPLARIARDVGFAVTVIDDRADFAQPERFPECSVIAEDFIPALRRIAFNRASYVVIITRGHEHDSECLGEVLTHETAYVGLIGSRRRVSFVLQSLAQNGIPQERLNAICTPIGVPIGAESPEEIALSIAAELVCVRRKGIAQAKTLGAAVRGVL